MSNHMVAYELVNSKNTFGSISKTSEIRNIKSKEMEVGTFGASILLRCVRLTSIFSANSSCDNPFSFL